MDGRRVVPAQKHWSYEGTTEGDARSRAGEAGDWNI